MTWGAAILAASFCTHNSDALAAYLSLVSADPPVVWSDVEEDGYWESADLMYGYSTSPTPDGGFSTGLSASGHGSASTAYYAPWTWHASPGCDLMINASAKLRLEGNPGEQADVTVSWSNSLVSVLFNVNASPFFPCVSGTASECAFGTLLPGTGELHFVAFETTHLEENLESYIVSVPKVTTQQKQGSFSAGRMTVGDELWINHQYAFETLAMTFYSGEASATAIAAMTATYSLTGVVPPPDPPDPPDPAPFPPLPPVPEPGTLALMAVGALIVRRRRK